MEWVLDKSVFDFSFFGKSVLCISLFNCVGFSNVGFSNIGFSNVGLSNVGFSNVGKSNFNTNLGPATTARTVLDSLPYADAVARLMGLPVSFTCCRADLAGAVAADAAFKAQSSPLFPLVIQKLYYQLEAD